MTSESDVNPKKERVFARFIYALFMLPGVFALIYSDIPWVKVVFCILLILFHFTMMSIFYLIKTREWDIQFISMVPTELLSLWEIEKDPRRKTIILKHLVDRRVEGWIDALVEALGSSDLILRMGGAGALERTIGDVGMYDQFKPLENDIAECRRRLMQLS